MRTDVFRPVTLPGEFKPRSSEQCAGFSSGFVYTVHDRSQLSPSHHHHDPALCRVLLRWFHFSKKPRRPVANPLCVSSKFPPSPAWHRNQRRLRARARVAFRFGLALKDQTLRLQRHHGGTLPKVITWYGGPGNSSWCAGCRSWKWERGTRCCCKTKKDAKKALSDGNLLDSNAVLACASRADLQTTIRQLEKTRAWLVPAPDAEAAVRICTEALKTELYTRDPPCVLMS